MIKNLQPNKLYFSTLCVRDALDDENRKIDEITKGKIILSGGRGTGKSIVLHDREKKSIGTADPAMLMRFDACGIFGKREDDVFNSSLMKHYYEVLMSKNMLNYIETYYPILFEKEFRDLDEKMHRKIKEVDNYINNAYFRSTPLPRKYFTGEVSSEILSRFRRYAGVESVTLMMDRFDWMHNSDHRVQGIMRNYFDMFDKVIITCDDKNATKGKRARDLVDRGFTITEVGYCKDGGVIRDIVTRRFTEDPENIRNPFPIKEVSDSTFDSLIDRSGGNITTILGTFNDCQTQYEWDDKDFDVDKQLQKSCERELRRVKTLRSICKGPKLHI